MVSVEYAEAFSQVLYVLDNMEPNLVSKVPQKVIRVLKENSLEGSNLKLEYTGDLKNMKLSSKACSVLAIIYLNCLCSSEEKAEYIKLLQKNDEIYQNMENNKVGFENIFDNETKCVTDNTQEITDMKVYKKENIFISLINKIKKFFRLK